MCGVGVEVGCVLGLGWVGTDLVRSAGRRLGQDVWCGVAQGDTGGGGARGMARRVAQGVWWHGPGWLACRWLPK
jgi:hypothetical protein